MKTILNTSVIYFFIFAGLFFRSDKIFSQSNSENGYHLPLAGTIRVLLVFAEVMDPQNCPAQAFTVTHSTPNWPSGSMPLDAADYLNPNSPAETSGKITDFFNEASFGQFIGKSEWHLFSKYPDR